MERGKESFDEILNSKNNFENLENKIKNIISECDENSRINIVETDYIFDSDSLGLDNVEKIEVYRLNDLYVYKYLNKLGAPINYRISENILIDNRGRLNSNVPCIEYSKGGVGNGAYLKEFDGPTHLLGKSISFVCNDGSLSPCLLRASHGGKIEVSRGWNSDLLFSLFDGRLSRSSDEYRKNGDLLKAIDILDFDNKIGIKSIFDKVEKRTLNNSSRKNYLKSLLLKLFRKNVELDAFYSGKGNRR